MQYLAETYTGGIYRGVWFPTIADAQNWIAEQRPEPDWTKVTPRGAVMAEAAKQDEILRSMGNPKI